MTTYKSLESVIREMKLKKKPSEEDSKDHHDRQQKQKQIIDNT